MTLNERQAIGNYIKRLGGGLNNTKHFMATLTACHFLDTDEKRGSRRDMMLGDALKSKTAV